MTTAGRIGPVRRAVVGEACDMPMAAVLLATLAVWRLLLPWAPDRLFDLDPASVPGPFAVGGPGLSMVLDAAMLVVAGGVLARLVRRGGGLDPWLAFPALVPLLVLLVHAREDVLHAWRGFDWLAATMLGVALAHLVRRPASRRAVVAVLVGGIAAMGVRGGWQVFGEHPATVAYFDAHRAEILAARGWTPDSAAALAFERRLRQPEATGWIGFSNVFSGLAAAGAIMLVGGLAAWRLVQDRRVEAGGPVLVGLAGVALAVLVGLNGSKGAIAASLLAVAVLGAILGPMRRLESRRLGAVVLALGGLALIAIVGRGFLPESTLGDRSLLFRWHYLQGAWSMVAEHPWRGVGPDGFQDAYLLHRPLRSPEAVASGHGMIVDWVASLGLIGLAWALVAGVMLTREDDEPSSPATPTSPLAAAGVAGAIVVSVLVLQAAIERPVDASAIAVRVAAAAFGGLVGFAVHGLFDALDGRTIRRLALAGAVVVIAQGQIDMLFWQPGSVAVCWAWLAIAGGARPRPGRGVEIVGPITIGAAVIAATLGFAEMRDARRAEAALAPLFGTLDRDGRVEPDLRRGIAAPLASLSEDETWWDDRVIRGAIDLYMAAGEDDDLRAAGTLADRWLQRRPGPVAATVRATILREGASRGLVEPAAALAAVDAAISFDPHEPRRRIDRAELLVELERFEEALAAVDDAMRLDAAHDLDPLAGIGKSEQVRIDAVRRSVAATDADTAQEPRP